VTHADRRIGRTGHADVDRFLDGLRRQVEAVLGSEFRGMYIGGSLALGAFDRASDIDVVIATSGDVRHRFPDLDLVHRQLARERVWFATELECIYMSQVGLRRFDRAHAAHLKLDRGPGEALKVDTMDESWVVHCHVLRTAGITWAGPDPTTLIEHVSHDDLRATMCGLLAGWAADLVDQPDRLRAPGYQSYAVLSLCRILYTLYADAIVSKLDAAEWAVTALRPEWHDLIRQAVADRMRDRASASEATIAQTLRLIEYAQTSAGISKRLANER
jgi:hypothetical protein